MRNPNKPTKSDLEICRDKIKQLLNEFNCSLYSSEDYTWVYLQDNDTRETIGFKD
jgi:hypothetical protein